MSSARVRLPADLESLVRSKMLQCIEEANLGQFDTTVAKRYLIDQLAQIDIAAELGCVRQTVAERVPRILEKVRLAAIELGYLNLTEF